MAGLVVVARYATLPEAVVAQGYLQENGIYATIPDYNFASANSHLLTALNAVRLMVIEEDLTAARRLLLEAFEPDTEHCPACMSPHVFRAKPKLWTGMAVLSALLSLTVTPSLPTTAERRCRDCGHRWISEPPSTTDDHETPQA